MHGGCLLTVRGPVPTKTRISRLGDVGDSYTATRLRRWLQFKHKTKRRKGGDLSTLASLWALWARTPDKSARPGVLPGAIVGADDVRKPRGPPPSFARPNFPPAWH